MWPMTGTALGKVGGRFAPWACCEAIDTCRQDCNDVRSHVTRNGLTTATRRVLAERTFQSSSDVIFKDSIILRLQIEA